ncbi:MAG: hypothetical protein RLZZ584_2633 [Pseudomonadota bacterium]
MQHKHSLAITSLVTALAGAAATPALAQSGLPVRPFVGFGLTGGGDELATVRFTDGSSESISAGGLIEFKAGVDWRVAGPFSLRGSFGYHVDDSSARNGSMRFERFPLELLACWHGSDRFRLGAGVRQATGARLRSSGRAGGVDGDFTADPGTVFEGEYWFTPYMSVYGRGVAETYRISSLRFNGNHVGVGVNFYF